MEQRTVSFQEFKDVLDNRIERMRVVMAAKNAEYASGEDKCHNFNAAARVNDTTPEKALWGMYTKHLVSIMDLIGWIETAPEKITRELIEEKMGDAINYHVLLEALLLAFVRDRDECEHQWQALPGCRAEGHAVEMCIKCQILREA